MGRRKRKADDDSAVYDEPTLPIATSGLKKVKKSDADKADDSSSASSKQPNRNAEKNSESKAMAVEEQPPASKRKEGGPSPMPMAVEVPISIPTPAAPSTSSSSSSSSLDKKEESIGTLPYPTDNPRGTSYGRGFFRTADRRQATRKGKFSKEEKEKLYAKLEEYLTSVGKTMDDLPTVCSREGNSEFRGMWMEVATALPERPISSIYDHVVRKWAPKKTGAWDDKEIEVLKELVKERGRQWAHIGRVLNRYPGSCRDKYRLVGKKYGKGAFTAEEDAELLRLVRESGDGAGLPRENIMWTAISDRLKTRSHSACRNRYFSAVYKQGLLEDLGSKRKVDEWQKEKDFELVNAIITSGGNSENELNFRYLVDGYPAEMARRRLATLRRRVRDESADTLQKQMSFLVNHQELLGLSYYREGMQLHKTVKNEDGTEARFKRKKDGSLRVARSKSAYMYFVKDRFHDTKKTGGDEQQHAVLKKLAQEWKFVGAEEKAQYEKLAAEDKLRFENEKAELEKYKRRKAQEEAALHGVNTGLLTLPSAPTPDRMVPPTGTVLESALNGASLPLPPIPGAPPKAKPSKKDPKTPTIVLAKLKN